MTDTQDQSQLLPSMPELTPAHIMAVQVFFAEHGVSKDEGDRLLDPSEHGPLARALDEIRRPATCGLWSKETMRRYSGGM